MAFTQFNLFGNVLDVRPAGKNKVIVLAEATFSNDQSKESDVFDVMSFSRQSEAVAAIEEALAAHRAETGNEKAALTGVHLTARLKPQTTKNAEGKNIKGYQVQLVRIGKAEPKVVEAKTATDAPVEAKATPATAKATAEAVAEDDVPF